MHFKNRQAIRDLRNYIQHHLGPMHTVSVQWGDHQFDPHITIDESVEQNVEVSVQIVGLIPGLLSCIPQFYDISDESCQYGKPVPIADRDAIVEQVKKFMERNAS